MDPPQAAESASRSNRVLVLCDHFLPGFHAGGPVRSIANLVSRLGGHLSFGIITRDRDLGAAQPYDDCPVDEWTDRHGTKVHYVSPGRLRYSTLAHLLRRTSADVLYLNSYCSWWFSIVPLLMRRIRLLPTRRTVLAPRGELAPSALQRHAWRKRAYRSFSKWLGLHRGVVWQATTPYEAQDIQRWIGPSVQIAIAPVLPPDEAPRGEIRHGSPQVREKPRGRLRVLFLSRIHPIKNLHFAIARLMELQGSIEFTIHGPVEDSAYWKQCQELLGLLPKQVHWHYGGPVPRDRLASVFAQHDVLLLPTLGENFGHVILESLLAGCPVVISDRTPWRNLARDGGGWELPLEQPAQFDQTLQRLIDSAPAEYRQVAESAVARGREFCDDIQIRQQNLELFLGAA